MIQIPAEILGEMVAHSVACLPEEACGLLAGSGDRVERFYPMSNADRSAVTYRLDSKEQLAVFDEIENKNSEVLGIFHSHTHTEAYPSETDRRQAFYPEIHYLLLSLADQGHPVLRGYIIQGGVVEEQEVTWL